MILKLVIASVLCNMVRLTTSAHRDLHSDFQGSRVSAFLSGRLFETEEEKTEEKLVNSKIGRARSQGEEDEQVRPVDPVEKEEYGYQYRCFHLETDVRRRKKTNQSP